MSTLISKNKLPQLLKKNPEWELEGKAIVRDFEFDEFVQAIDFVNDVAEIAEEAHHHPDIDIRWTKIRCALTTHDKGGITDLDFEVAARIDTLVD